VKVAVTSFAVFIATVHVPVPVHPPPDQPVNVDDESGAAVRVTDDPSVMIVEQVVPQSMPGVVDVTLPLPVPLLETVSERPKVAVTERTSDIVTMHGPLPLQAPDQPANVDPVTGVAVSSTVMFQGNEAEHATPQLMPAGREATVPEPEPFTVTERSVGRGRASSAANRPQQRNSPSLRIAQ
jgi:hypothetical protein